MSFNLLYPRVDWTYQLQATGIAADISGAPTCVVGPSDEVYFAFSAKGTVGTLANVNNYQIVVGCVSSSGALQWLFRDPQLVSSATDSQPALALGTAGELYLVFVTTGAVPGKLNGLVAPSFCGSCGSLQGPEDIVVARINGATAGTPVVSWVVQDLSVNSCSREMNPRILYDIYANRLLLAYTSTGAVICAARVGTPNIIVTCLDPPTGGLVWVHQSNSMNCGGENGQPSIAVDPAGGIYIAYTITAQVVGGGTFIGSLTEPRVEVIKITASGSPLVINRNWILSSVSNVNPPVATVNNYPYLAYDPIKTKLYLAFVTSGTVPGGTPTPGASSHLVVASINPLTAALNWLNETPEYNEGGYRYSSISELVFTIDPNGVPYLAASAIQTSTSSGMIFMYRFNPDNGKSGWIYYDSSIAFRAYLPAIQSVTTPNTAFRVGANYSGPWIAIRSGNLYVAFINQDTETFQLVGLRQVQRYQDITAFEYMRDFTGICG